MTLRNSAIKEHSSFAIDRLQRPLLMFTHSSRVTVHLIGIWQPNVSKLHRRFNEWQLCLLGIQVAMLTNWQRLMKLLGNERWVPHFVKCNMLSTEAMLTKDSPKGIYRNKCRQHSKSFQWLTPPRLQVLLFVMFSSKRSLDSMLQPNYALQTTLTGSLGKQ